MALRGSLHDFGISDVFSLIASQNKTGLLYVLSEDEQATLFFAEGALVHTEATRRQQHELLGNRLIRAEVLTAAQIGAALAQQKNSKQRLGEVLVHTRLLSASQLQTFMRLQSAETVYRMLLWRTGTYEFVQMAINPPATHPPLRAETLLMEGFHQNDVWPQIRKVLPSYALKFVVHDAARLLLETQPPPLNSTTAGQPETTSVDDFDLQLDALAPSASPEPTTVSHEAQRLAAALKQIGPREKLVLGLIQPERDVQKIIDMSCLGEFATCQALVTLLEAQCIGMRSARADAPSAEASVGGIHEQPILRLKDSWRQWRKLVVALGVWLLFWLAGRAPLTPAGPAAKQLRQQLQAARLQYVHNILAVQQARHGVYPARLHGLVAGSVLAWPTPLSYTLDASATAYTLTVRGQAE